MASHAHRFFALMRRGPAFVALACGLAGLGLSVALGATAGRLLAWLLPVDPADVDPLEALAACVGLVALGMGLVRRKRLAWWLAVSVFGAALIDQSTVRYPVATGLALGCLAVLAADRRRYRVASDGRAVRPVLALMILTVGIIVVQAAVFDVTGPIWTAPLVRVRDALEATADALALSGAPLPHDLGSLHLADSVVDAARFLLVGVALLILRAVPGPEARGADALRARTIAQRYAAGSLRPFQLGDDKLLFSPKGVDAAIVYGEAGRFAVMLGDPIGRPKARTIVLRKFAEASERSDRRPAAYQVSNGWRRAFEALGFRLIPVGSEAVLDLSTFDLSGSRRANLRHTVARARRGGVRVEWFPDGVVDRATLDRLSVIDEQWRRRRRAPELRFTIHPFDPRALPATAVACEADGTASAFATFLPTGKGTWVLDLMRRAGGTPGALESCIAEAAGILAGQGAVELSLGLAPLAGLRRDGSIEERLLVAGARLASHSYDVRGLEFFKDKFAPRWEPRYLAVRTRSDVFGIALALVRLHVAGSRASVVRLLASAAQSWPGRRSLRGEGRTLR
jgi:phosphatidylglycerol lysyltransferase